MSQANIPNINPQITIKREDVINLLIASIAMEELGLSHIINAEGEKLQFVLGTLPQASLTTPATFEEVLKANESVRLMLKEIGRKEQVLNDRLELIINVPSNQNPPEETVSVEIPGVQDFSKTSEQTDSGNTDQINLSGITDDVDLIGFGSAAPYFIENGYYYFDGEFQSNAANEAVPVAAAGSWNGDISSNGADVILPPGRYLIHYSVSGNAPIVELFIDSAPSARIPGSRISVQGTGTASNAIVLEATADNTTIGMYTLAPCKISFATITVSRIG